MKIKQKIKSITPYLLIAVGALLAFEGYRVSRPAYYLTQIGSSSDDYTAAGYMMMIIGIFISIIAFIYILRNSKRNFQR